MCCPCFGCMCVHVVVCVVVIHVAVSVVCVATVHSTDSTLISHDIT